MTDPRCLYTAFFCEENVWHLCSSAAVRGGQRHVLWITNARRACPFWAQRAARRPGQPVWWDYHVVLLTDAEGGTVWDLDTELGFPVGLENYLRETFGAAGELEADIAPSFRVIPAADYMSGFASDRSHMRRADGSWLAPPPPWPPIDGGASETFDQLMDVAAAGMGPVLSREELEARFF